MNWLNFIHRIISLMGPDLRNMLTALVKDWEIKAKATKDNPFDDFFVLLLKIALDIK